MRFLLLSIFIILSEICFAQVFQGKLIDEKNNIVDFALAQIKNSDVHSHSNEQGIFQLKQSKIGDTIVITHFLYEPKIVIISTKSYGEVVTIKLTTKENILEDINIVSTRPVLKTLAKIDLQSNPVTNSQELLRLVPGLIIGQHAGGGKAEQIFLRGFDVDHGTDISMTVDNLPVNMVSHAHGQGYADLHFLIPETVDDIEYGKGPYYTDKGNFTTAGFIAFKTKSQLSHSSIKTEIGQFGTLRTIALVDLTSKSKTNNAAYLAGEYFLSDGPFDAPQAFKRINLFGKYNYKISPNQNLVFSLSNFSSRWDASGQIPERAVNAGLISRFGAIDKTEGGITSRRNLNIQYEKTLSPTTSLNSNIYFSNYNFDLYSNFTFFLHNPIDGDQIKQSEKRNLYGLNFNIVNNTQLGHWSFSKKIYSGFRQDDVTDHSLANTKNRTTFLKSLSLGDINESNFFTGVNLGLASDKFFINFGLRADYFKFIYLDKLNQGYKLLESNKTVLQPKLNIQYSVNNSFQIYAKAGRGFHTNDARVAVSQDVNKTIPAAYGVDLGIVVVPVKKLLINAALWSLKLDQEFVYVGDEAIVENGGRTLRQGIDFSVRYNPYKSLFLYNNICLANPKSLDNDQGQNYIPLAPTFTNTGGLNFNYSNFNIGLRYRQIYDRPANEDKSIIAKGYTIFDGNITYEYKKIIFGFDILNALNSEWNETQFATLSRLKNESKAVEEIHFTPGAPFMIKGKVEYKF